MDTFTNKGRNSIHLYRMLSKYSQKDLAHLLGLPASTISRWENGSRTPTVYYAIGISVALHRLVDAIFSDYRSEWVERINQNVKTLPKQSTGFQQP